LIGYAGAMIEIRPLDAPSSKTEYQPYDADLPLVFDELAAFLRDQMSGARVEHVGSSSVPGLGGRNVLDVVVTAPEAEHELLRTRLVGLGFQPSPFRHFLPLLVASVSRQEKSFSVLLYVLTPESDMYHGWIAFRDHMRAHPEDAAAYERIKRAAITEGNGDMESYQRAKTPFVVAIANQITKSGRRHG